MTARPALGYPTQTAAIAALRQDGLSTRAIAQELGISAGDVTALEWREAHPRSAASSGKHDPMITIPAAAIDALRPHAARRRMSLTRLAARIVAAVAGGGLVDQVLDGKPEKGREG